MRRVEAGRWRPPQTVAIKRTQGPPRTTASGCVSAIQIGGGGGIRTHGRREPSVVFKTTALNHSATPPRLKQPQRSRLSRPVRSTALPPLREVNRLRAFYQAAELHSAKDLSLLLPDSGASAERAAPSVAVGSEQSSSVQCMLTRTSACRSSRHGGGRHFIADPVHADGRSGRSPSLRFAAPDYRSAALVSGSHPRRLLERRRSLGARHCEARRRALKIGGLRQCRLVHR